MATGCGKKRNEGFYSCEECPKAFNRMASYEAHIRMHAQEELDVFDIVFNYAGKILDVPLAASSPSQRTKRKFSSRQSPMRRTSPRKTPPGKTPQTELSPAPCFPLTKPVATLKPSTSPTINTLDAAAKSSPTPQEAAVLSPQEAAATAEEEMFSLHDSGVHSEPTYFFDGEPDTLLVKVPLTMCSTEFLRNPVVSLSKQENQVEKESRVSPKKVLQSSPILPQSSIRKLLQQPPKMSRESYLMAPHIPQSIIYPVPSLSNVSTALSVSKIKSDPLPSMSKIKSDPFPSMSKVKSEPVPSVSSVKSGLVPCMNNTCGPGPDIESGPISSVNDVKREFVPKKEQLKKRVLHDDSLKLEKIPLSTAPKSLSGQRTQCPECHKILCSVSSLKRHFRTHTGVRPYKCSHCSKGFSQPHHRNYHEKVHMTPDDQTDVSSTSTEQVHVCSVCGQKFMGKRMFKNHLTSHDVNRAFSCKICCMRFKKKTHLKVHMQTHTHDKVSACQICKKKFYRSDHLNKHLRIHFREEAYTNAVTGDIMYVCKYCPKICRTAGGLSKHHTVHFMKQQICLPPPSLAEEREKGEVCAPNLHISLDLPQNSEKSEGGITDADTDGAMADISGEGATSESFGSMDSELDLSDSETTFSEVEEEEESEEEDESLMIDSDQSSDQSSDEDGNIVHFLPGSHGRPPSNGAAVSSHMTMVQHHMSCRNSHCQGKPYKCEWCGRRFSRNSNLYEHYRLHRQIPHQCDRCGKVFMSQLYLKRHIRAKHSSS